MERLRTGHNVQGQFSDILYYDEQERKELVEVLEICFHDETP